jgi:hypothetical protein
MPQQWASSCGDGRPAPSGSGNLTLLESAVAPHSASNAKPRAARLLPARPGSVNSTPTTSEGPHNVVGLEPTIAPGSGRRCPAGSPGPKPASPDRASIGRNAVTVERSDENVVAVFTANAGEALTSTNGKTLASRKSVGRDRSSRTTPPHLRVPALHASGAGRGISRAHDALVKSPGTGQWDPAIIGATLTVTVGQATTVHRRGTPLDEEWDEPGYGVVALPPATRGACNAAGRRVWLWPAILRHLGRGHGRSPDYRPHGGCSAFVGGGSPTNSARPPALWS